MNKLNPASFYDENRIFATSDKLLLRRLAEEDMDEFMNASLPSAQILQSGIKPTIEPWSLIGNTSMKEVLFSAPYTHKTQSNS